LKYRSLIFIAQCDPFFELVVSNFDIMGVYITKFNIINARYAYQNVRINLSGDIFYTRMKTKT